MIRGDAIAREAQRYVGVPFRHRGRSVKGIDCAGLVVLVRNAVLGTHDDDLAYTEATQPARVLEAISPFMRPVGVGQPGDVALLARGAHLGIVTHEGVVHASPEAGRVVQTQRKAVRAYYRLRGVQ